MAAPFTIMCFSWNASGLKLCETTSQDKADEARKGFRGFIQLKQPCLAPDFFEEIRTTILVRTPSLVVITTEDEDKSDTYFHSDLLSKTMPEMGYSLLKRDKLSDVGEVTSSLQQMRVPTGKPSGSALRMSIYAKNDVMPALRYEEKQISKLFPNNGQVENIWKQGNDISGAIGSYVWHETYGKFLFIGAHFTSSPDSFGKDLDYVTYRSASKSANNIYLISMMSRLVYQLPQQSRPDHIFLLGDLNYNIVVPDRTNIDVISQISANITAQSLRNYQQYDELKQSLNDPVLKGFKEGVAGEGPLFMPTWKLARNRPNSCIPTTDTNRVAISCFGQPDALGGIGWHDRILYKEEMTSNYMAHCVDYNRLDIRNMHGSTNAGVTAFFEMKSII